MTVALAALLAFFVSISPIISGINAGVNAVSVTEKVATDVHARILAHRQKHQVAAVATPPRAPVSQAQPIKESAGERAACSPAAFRFCLKDAILGKRGATLDCLIAHKQQIGKLCRDVLTSHGL
jgi:hypothetical protein